MESMIQSPTTTFSYPEYASLDMKSQITQAYESLLEMMKEQANRRRGLEEMFDKQESDAQEAIQIAMHNAEVIKTQREKMRRQLEGIEAELIGRPSKRRDTEESTASTIPAYPAMSFRPVPKIDVPDSQREDFLIPPSVHRDTIAVEGVFVKDQVELFEPYKDHWMTDDEGSELEFEDTGKRLKIRSAQMQQKRHQARADKLEEASQRWERIRETWAQKGNAAGRELAEEERKEALREAERFRQFAEDERRIICTEFEKNQGLKMDLTIMEERQSEYLYASSDGSYEGMLVEAELTDQDDTY